jgi:hypothetical protein
MNPEDSQIEALLARYRPAGPPDRLRGRVLTLAEPRVSRWWSGGWAAVAAVLALSLGLHWTTQRQLHDTATLLREPSGTWTAEADEAAELINGHGAGRRYLALALAVGQVRPEAASGQSMLLPLWRDPT